MNERREIDLLVRAQLKGREELKGVAKSIGEIESAIKSQSDAAKSGETDLEKLLTGLRALKRDSAAAAKALGATLDFQRQSDAVEKFAAKLAAAKQKLADFDATLTAGAALTDRQIAQQTRLGAAIERASATYDKAKARLQGTATVLADFGISTDKLAGEQSRLAAAIANANTGIRAHEDAIDRATAAQQRMGQSGVAEALGRFKSQAVALAAAYVGVRQGADLAKGAVDEFSSREGIKNQLALSVGNDKAAIDAEYAYVKAQSDRIGLEFDKAAQGFAKFSAAATLAGRSRQEIRFIWEAFAEVGRVANLSTEDMQGVFKALEQITSKGKIQAEELRGQLGDRLFGAFQVAAKALQDQFPNLDKSMKDGEVTADQLVAIAAKYREIVADQLPGATSSLAAEQARLTNAVLDFKLAIADAGWADAFRAALVQITAALRSEDGQKFAQGLAAGFSAAANAAVWLLQNSNEVLIVLKALAGLWALNAAGKAAEGVTAYAGVLNTLAGDLRTTVNGLGLVRGAFAAIQAFLVGWSIGAFLSEEFAVVRKAGVYLVTGLDEAWTRIRAGAEWLFSELPRLAKNGFALVLNGATLSMRDLLGIIQKGLFALGRTDEAAKVGGFIDALTAKFEGASDRAREIRERLAAELVKIRAIRAEMLADAERAPRTSRSQPATTVAAPTTAPEKTKGGIPAGPTDAEITKRERAVEQITRSLEALDAKIDRSQTDSLQSQLDAIDSTYAGLARKIGALGGETGRGFMAQLDASISQLRAQTIAKFTADLDKEQAGILAKLEAVDAAAGRKSETDLQARLDAIRLKYEATYREIADFRAKLESNGRSTSDADAARARLDAGIAELRQLEVQRFNKDEVHRLEGQINDLLATRSDRLKTIHDQEEAGLITAAEARTQTQEAVTAMQPQIASLVEMAIAFAESLRGAFDPVALDAFVAKLQLAKGSGDGLSKTFEITGKQVQDLIATRSVQAFDAMGDAIAGAVVGTRSWGDALRATGQAFLRFAADFLREIAMMILKAMILKAIQATSWGSGIAGFLNAAVQHGGGLVGGPASRSRAVSPFMFIGAPRYHSGGIPGLRPDEYATILQRNEEVLSKGDPRNILNGGAAAQPGAAAPAASNRFILVDDRAQIPEYMRSAEGENVFIEFLQRNAMTVRSIVGGA